MIMKKVGFVVLLLILNAGTGFTETQESDSSRKLLRSESILGIEGRPLGMASQGALGAFETDSEFSEFEDEDDWETDDLMMEGSVYNRLGLRDRAEKEEEF